MTTPGLEYRLKVRREIDKLKIEQVENSKRQEEIEKELKAKKAYLEEWEEKFTTQVPFEIPAGSTIEIRIKK